MTHFSENVKHLEIIEKSVTSRDELIASCQNLVDVCIIVLPSIGDPNDFDKPHSEIGKLIADASKGIQKDSTLVVIGEVIDLVQVQSQIPDDLTYQMWISIKRRTVHSEVKNSITNGHFGGLVYTKYKGTVKHTKTRLYYTYCPHCDKTTKDYGGKKHTYHSDGTSISDVWNDIPSNLSGDLSLVISRFADLFGLYNYNNLTVVDAREINLDSQKLVVQEFNKKENELPESLINKILNGDCIEQLKELPDNSIDFVFTDPPYNLEKKYSGYSDDLDIQAYFKWCDEWIHELYRVLKPGRTLALLNIPIWAVRHFLYMQTIMQYQNWIVWDALAFPVRQIMPAHYTILCFTKGESRELPYLTNLPETNLDKTSAPLNFNILKPLAENYCIREKCVKDRMFLKVDDKANLTDVWSDIHRLKHNSRRVDHPTQLPPHLMYRILSIFTKQGETVLDCFNGSGTTTLTAHQMGRRYIGIEKSEQYWALANSRHEEVNLLQDPFRKEERVLTAKNSPVKRLEKQVYEVPKKTLQLEVKRVFQEIGHLPSRDEMIELGKYKIEYYDKYFTSWGEVCAAARTNGMVETRK